MEFNFDISPIRMENMTRQSRKIYCAGPLFNPMERKEMADIAMNLQSGGYGVFLPQQDGLEFAKLYPVLIQQGLSSENARRILNSAIFALDVYEITHCDGLLLNMNGRVPDEGAMVEAGIAWSYDKIMVIFKTDDRSLVEGVCNPLVMGLTDFEFVSKYTDIAGKFDHLFDALDQKQKDSISVSEQIKTKGETISQYLSGRKSPIEIAELLVDLFGRSSCPNTSEKIRTYTLIP